MRRAPSGTTEDNPHERKNPCPLTPPLPGGTFELAPDITVNRVGYGAMQLAGPHVFGPPADREEAIRVLREAIDLGIDHIDTSDFYGPHVTNEIIKEALHPYPENLTHRHQGRRETRRQRRLAPRPLAGGAAPAVHDNLEHLGLEAMDVVNLRLGGRRGPGRGAGRRAGRSARRDAEEGLIRHLGVSTFSPAQIAEARAIAPIVCVQNLYNVANRGDDELIDALAADGIAYVPYFPLGGFSPLQEEELDAVAERNGATPMAVALAWLLQRSPNILLIPGTSSVAHLRENVAGAGLELSAEDLAELDSIAG